LKTHCSEKDSGFFIFNDVPERAESQADNLAKTTVEHLWVRDWETSSNLVTVFVHWKPQRRAAMFGGRRWGHFAALRE